MRILCKEEIPEFEDEDIDPRGFKRQHGHKDRRDLEETTLKAMRVEVSTFDGRLDPKCFLDWVRGMDQYFDWYDISPHRQPNIQAYSSIVGVISKFGSSKHLREALGRLYQQQAAT